MKNVRNVIYLPLLILIIGCASNKVDKIYWTGNLVQNSGDINYLYWNDGNQFITQQQDSITASIAGFEFENTVYILVSLTNNKSYPITFFTKENKISYVFNKENINLLPVKPKNLDKDHFSFFNTVVNGAGSISRLFLNIPVDMLFKTNKEESNSPSTFGAEYHDEKINMTKKIFMSNHTLFPGTNYAGFLVFEFDEEKNVKEHTFVLSIKMGIEFKIQGGFTN